jgi:hypothetical protein
VVKYRRGGGRYFETRNVTDDGAGSPGRLITEALQATRFARAVVEDLAPGTDLLIVWRWAQGGHAITTSDHHPPVGFFRFGVADSAGSAWARSEGLEGSPFRRGRRTVNALVRREPGQNSQATHDRDYVLVDQRVQQEAADIIAAGAERARQAVLVADLHAGPDPDDRETARADCHDYKHSPFTGSGEGCRASFLMCLGCTNARIHPCHHSRLAHLHRALNHLRSAQPPTVWEADWGKAHARLEVSFPSSTLRHGPSDSHTAHDRTPAFSTRACRDGPARWMPPLPHTDVRRRGVCPRPCVGGAPGTGTRYATEFNGPARLPSRRDPRAPAAHEVREPCRHGSAQRSRV